MSGALMAKLPIGDGHVLVENGVVSALDAFRQAFVEQLWLSHLQMAYTLPFLDRTDEAKAHVASILKLSPGFTIREADAYYAMWCFPQPYREKMRGALRKAGLPH